MLNFEGENGRVSSLSSCWYEVPKPILPDQVFFLFMDLPKPEWQPRWFFSAWVEWLSCPSKSWLIFSPKQLRLVECALLTPPIQPYGDEPLPRVTHPFVGCSWGLCSVFCAWALLYTEKLFELCEELSWGFPTGCVIWVLKMTCYISGINVLLFWYIRLYLLVVFVCY